MSDLDKKGFVESMKDHRVKKAFSTWSSCMREHGYNYVDPFAPAADPRFQGERETREEVQVAITDVKCKQKVRLIPTWFSVERGLQEVEIGAAGGRLAHAKVRKEAQLGKARRVLP
ncbi:hypothetical protein [Streptomyces cucumeris]|uniref:hypothetical protein n=1 Tax=Streptomyces cucumeris TaxID=2962890 RepID=UPI003EB69909